MICTVLADGNGDYAVTWLSALATFLSAGAAFAAIYYVHRSNELARQAQEFSATEQIHGRLTTLHSHAIRRYISTDFAQHLREALEDTPGLTHLCTGDTPPTIDVNKVLQLQWPEEEGRKKREATHEKFKQELARRQSGVPDANAREAVEYLLLDMDLLAIPIWLGIRAAENVTRAYKPVLENTARAALPFVLLEGKLRAEEDYKFHYLYMLLKLGYLEGVAKELKIDTTQIAGLTETLRGAAERLSHPKDRRAPVEWPGSCDRWHICFWTGKDYCPRL